MTKLQKETLDLLDQGFAVSEIAKKLNRNMTSISSIIKRFEVTNYKKLNENLCNHNYFDNIDDEYKAYLLGFFIADGYLHSKSNRFGVNIQNQDRIILEYLNKLVCPNNKIYIKNRTTSKIKRVDQCSLRWSSFNMKNIFIEKYKILDNKTLDVTFDFPFEEIPNNLIRHFIRGFIDGDGSFSNFGNSLSIILIGTSKIFLNNIGKILSNLSEGVEYNIKEKKGKTTNWFVLSFNMFRTNKPDKILKIYNYLYSDSELYLKRKKDKMESYLKYRGKL